MIPVFLNTTDPRGFAFVIFHDASSVDNVMADKNKNQFHERLVDVKRFHATVAPRVPSQPDKDRLLPPVSSSSSYARSISNTDAYRNSSSTTPRNGGGMSDHEYSDFRIFVGGLAPDIDRHELRRVFEGFGSVLDAAVVADPNTTRSRGFGFVTFDRMTGQKAIDRILRIPAVQVRGKNVEVRRARAPAEPGGGNNVPPPREMDRYPDAYESRAGSMRRDSSGRGDYGAPPPPPVAQAVESYQCELFVGSLPFEVDRLELKRIFDLFGTVIDAIVVIDATTQRSRGFGFVTFDPADGPNAIERVIRAAPLQVRGRSIEVKRAKPPIDSGAPSSQRTSGMGADPGRGRVDIRGRDASPVQGGLYPHKIFVGGLPPDVDRMELRRLFERYGEVLDTIVMIDPATQRSRCFGFVSFDREYGADSVDRVIHAQPIQIGGRSVEIRRARPPIDGDGAAGGGPQRDLAPPIDDRPMHRDTDDYGDYRNNREDVSRQIVQNSAAPSEIQGLYKIFVGGLAPDIDRDELRRVFERYGDIVDTVVMIDPDTKRSSGFGFVTFDDVDGQKAVEHILQIQPVQIQGRTVEVKLASPQTLSDQSKEHNESISVNDDRVRTELPPEQSQYRVFVGGLPPEVDKAELRLIFERFGVVVDSVVMIDAATHRSRGFGFVTFDEIDGPNSIERALQAQPLQVHGRSVEIRRGRPPTAPGEGRGTKRNDPDARGNREYRPPRTNDYEDARPPSPNYDRRYDDDDERYKRSRY